MVISLDAAAVLSLLLSLLLSELLLELLLSELLLPHAAMESTIAPARASAASLFSLFFIRKYLLQTSQPPRETNPEMANFNVNIMKEV